MPKNTLPVVWVAPFLSLLFSYSLAAAQSPQCGSEKSAQFDFWIGEWEVFAQGQLAGTNSIRPILDGCVLLEDWKGSSGSRGASFNFFNPDTGKWQQFWVWKNGTTLELSGEYTDGKMVLRGESKSQSGEKILNRITWSQNKDGTVRQQWEASKDAGKTWNTVFDGHYKKKAP